jgi:solute carrier family 25 (mitochondrial adenine nucleotide translocator), member 4/5/6/31
LPPLPRAQAGIIVYRAGYFGLYDVGKSMLDPQAGVVAAWGVAQVTTALAGLVAYPFDTVRRRLMMQAGKPLEAREYRSTLDCWRKMAVNEGTRGFFKGAWTNTVRGAGAAVVLPLYDEVQKLIK